MDWAVSSLRLQQTFDVAQIRAPRDLWIDFGARHKLHWLPDQFASGGVVSKQQSFPPRLQEGAADNLDPESLWRLNCPEPRAIDRALDQLAIAGFLDRIRHW